MSDVACINTVIDLVNDRLTKELRTWISENDEARAGLVRPGLLQDDPTRYTISVLTHPNDPDNDKEWRHSVAEGKYLGVELPAYEVGGGQFWIRRFTTKLELYFRPNVDRTKARTIAGLVLARAEHAIWNVNFWDVTPDSLGELPQPPCVPASSVQTEGGGEGEYIWHCTIWWYVLTAKA